MDTPAANLDVPAIEMTGVTVTAVNNPDSPVLEDVNWRVNANEFWVIAGLHGSGKSELMYLTAGLMPPRDGTYRLFGHEMPIFGREHLAKRLRVGLVFDGGQLLHQLTVAENVALPLRYHRQLGEAGVAGQVGAMLELLELSPFADSAPGSLAPNWQKRAGLARALMLKPDVLLLDNPLGGLDMRQACWWLNFLHELAAGADFMAGHRMTLVLTARDLRHWKNQSAHFALLRQNRFVSLGHHVRLDGHGDPLVKELLAEEPAANS